MLALAAVPHPVSGQDYAEELAWWVEPAHRGSSIGPRLLAAAEAWCVQNKLGVLKMVAPAASDVGAFYVRRGYTLVESVYQKVLTP
jgi:GNAT superfamily N-acetyltransferase